MRDGTLVSNSEVPDLDGNTLDNRARVQLLREEGVTSELQLVPGLNGATGPYSSFIGGRVTVLLNPGLATPGPGKGKGKGLEKAPGQNR